MKSKPVVVVGVLAAALVALILTSRRSERPAPPRAAKAPAAVPAKPTLESHPQLASYRVFQEPAREEVLPYLGANYRAEVSPAGLRFEAGGHEISLRAHRIEQGGASLDLSAGAATRSRWAVAEVDRGSGVTEEFIFENGRAEHIVRVERPLGKGELKVRVNVDTNLTGPVLEVSMADKCWKDTTVENGGLVFTDAAGQPGMAYHTAVAIDAKGRRQAFDPRWENGEIALVVPADFMKDAAYPLLIDPWLELNFSGTGGGISKNGSVSETPALALIGGAAPCVAWSDTSDGDFDIYFRYWNGNEWAALGNVNVSANDGRSTNPSIGFCNVGVRFFHPYVAWEDDSSGTVNIYAKFWSGTSWTEFAQSASGSGVSQNIGTPCKFAQAVSTLGLIDTQGNFGVIPAIVYQQESVGIVCRVFWVGSDPDAGWYIHPSGLVSTQASSARPSARTDGTGRIVVAWEQSDGTDMDIFVARTDVVEVYAGSAGTFGFTEGGAIVGPLAPNSWLGVDSGTVGAENICVGLPDALSIQAALALDPAGNPWVAWQESVGAEQEIYVRASIAGGAWAGVAGSSAGLGVSGTTSLTGSASSFPSIAIASSTPIGSIVRPVVAWEETVGGNPDIYVRRLNAAGTAWDQVADEGSATPVGAELSGNSGGISRNSSFSLVPKAAIAPDGTITVAWRDGSLGTFDLYARRYHDNEPRNLSQAVLISGVSTPLPQGGTTSSTSVIFSATLVAESSAVAPLRLQLEIRPNTTPFNSIPTQESTEVASGGVATIVFAGLPNVNYHWQARSIDSLGRSSPWIPFGTNANGAIDFRISSDEPGAGGPNQIIGVTSESKDKCGLTGLEAFALLGLAAALRRRRR